MGRIGRRANTFAMGTGAWLSEVSSLRALRGAMARRFLLKLKRATHRAPVELIVPAARRVLVVAPHMDDEVIPCGGTLILLAEQGAEIHVTFATDSSAGLRSAEAAAQLIALRRSEAQRVSERIGYATNELGFPDGQLHRHEAMLTKRLTEQIARLEPEIIFCPFPADAHSDHMSCAAAVARAAVQAESGAAILAYEVWTPLWPNVAVDISRVAQRKEEGDPPLSIANGGPRSCGRGARPQSLPRACHTRWPSRKLSSAAAPKEFSRLTSLLDQL